MRYSHEYKLNCIELYRQGKWPETPGGIDERYRQGETYHATIEEKSAKGMENRQMWKQRKPINLPANGFRCFYSYLKE